MEDFSFAPDPARASALDWGVHRALGDRLALTCARARERVSFDEPALDALVGRLRRGLRHPPSAFAVYEDLLQALADDDLEAVEARFAELAAVPPAGAGARVVALDRVDRPERYARPGLKTPSREAADAFAVRYQRGMGLMRAFAPELAGEVDGVVHEVVVVVEDEAGPDRMNSGAHARLWGRLFLGADRHPTDFAMVEAIALESARNLLSGFCTDGPLVENGRDERFASPPDPDPRPMEEIYLGTFVSARAHWMIARLLASSLDAETRLAAKDSLGRRRRDFEAGFRTVAEHGRLTRPGRELMRRARAYMDAAA
jgi:HEXXH motif-containing protein